VAWTPTCSTQKQGTTGIGNNGKRKQCAHGAQYKPNAYKPSAGIQVGLSAGKPQQNVNATT
jgi:hypothetical protein